MFGYKHIIIVNELRKQSDLPTRVSHCLLQNIINNKLTTAEGEGKGARTINKTTDYCLNNVHIIFITTYTRHDVNLVLNHCIIIGICTLHNVYTYIAIHARPERLYGLYISYY